VYFRHDINGLRGIAVLLVVLYHFGFSLFGGGFAGVDVFFVISGFLMTGIIFSRMEKGNFSLLNFYLDRGRRIIPALSFLCLVILVVAWFFFFPSDYRALGEHVMSSVGFFSNVLYREETGYFDVSSHRKWLLHTWSLSVEWQFYVVYPVVIMLLHKLIGKSWVRWALAIITILSLLLSIYGSTKWPSEAFYLLPTRAWEMLAGGLLYLFPIRFSNVRSIAIEIIGLSLILLSVFFFTSSDIWPGWLAVIPVIGASFIILAQRNESLLTNNRVTQWLGKCSYSIYLWHWPVVVGLNLNGLLSQPSWIAVGILMSLSLGYLSFILIENPVRNYATNLPSLQQILIYIVIISILALVILTITNHPKVKFIDKYKTMHSSLAKTYRFECDFYNNDTNDSKDNIDESCVVNDNASGIFLWGDSHAQALSYGLSNTLRNDLGFYQVATSACRPSLAGQLHGFVIDNKCDYSNQYALGRIEELKPYLVIMAQERGHENKNWDEIAEKLYSLGVERIILVGPLLQWRPSLPLVIVENHWMSNENYIEDSAFDVSILNTDKILRQRYGDNKRIEYISVIESLCVDEACLAIVPDNGTLIAVDYGHLSPEGSLYIVQKVLSDKIGNPSLWADF
jgi:peptidoglycan/LPS O-acetylase OafA/YrhL